jgi:hypothetical protein
MADGMAATERTEGVMALIKGKKNPVLVNCCAVGCEGEKLDAVLKELNTNGWSIRQIFQVGLDYYRVFAQRELAFAESVRGDE